MTDLHPEFLKLRRRSLDRKQDFFLSHEQFISNYLDLPCAYCGEIGTSADLLIPELGYCLANLMPCCNTCINRRLIKGNDRNGQPYSEWIKQFAPNEQEFRALLRQVSYDYKHRAFPNDDDEDQEYIIIDEDYSDDH